MVAGGRRASRQPLMALGVAEQRRERATGRVGQGAERRGEHPGRVERVGAQGAASCRAWAKQERAQLGELAC